MKRKNPQILRFVGFFNEFQGLTMMWESVLWRVKSLAQFVWMSGRAQRWSQSRSETAPTGESLAYVGAVSDRDKGGIRGRRPLLRGKDHTSPPNKSLV